MCKKTGLGLFLLCFLAASSASAQGFKLPSPFKKKEPEPAVRTRLSDGGGAEEKKSAFRLPKLSMPKLPAMPGFKKSAAPAPMARRPQPTALEKFNQSAKAMFAKTKQTLASPFTTSKAPPKPPTRITRASQTKPKKNPFAFLPFAFSKEKEEPKKQTVGDFLRQQRPGFEQ